MRKQKGSIMLYGLIALGVITFAGGLVYTYQNAIKKAEQMANELEDVKAQKEALELQQAKDRVLNNAKIEALEIVRDSQQEASIAAERRKAKASASQISETSMRDAKKYEGFVERVMEKNVALLKCKSDFGRSRDEENPCVGHVR